MALEAQISLAWGAPTGGKSGGGKVKIQLGEPPRGGKVQLSALKKIENGVHGSSKQCSEGAFEAQLFGLSMMKFAKDLGGKEMCLESMSCMLEIAAQIF